MRFNSDLVRDFRLSRNHRAAIGDMRCRLINDQAAGELSVVGFGGQSDLPFVDIHEGRRELAECRLAIRVLDGCRRLIRL